MNYIRVTENSKDFPLVQALKERVFPPEEQLPLPLMMEKAHCHSANLWGFYEDERFCGFSYTVASEKILFVLYLAVDNTLHSQGYGSRCLSLLDTIADGRTIALNVEIPHADAPNNEQRLRRIAFYERNGFAVTPYHLNDGKTTFSVLAKGSFVPEDYRSLLVDFSDGLFTPSVFPAKSG